MTTAPQEATVVRLWHAGFKEDKRITAWDKRRDKIVSILRRLQSQRPQGAYTIGTQPFLSKVQR